MQLGVVARAGIHFDLIEVAKMSKLHHIHAKPDFEGFRLYNFSAPCGARLVKGEGFPLLDSGFPREPWEEDWTRYGSLQEAEEAAKKLQEYLDAHEASHKKNKPTKR